eukprot:8616837-Pyramimonas_sp.AAC.1
MYPVRVDHLPVGLLQHHSGDFSEAREPRACVQGVLKDGDVVQAPGPAKTHRALGKCFDGALLRAHAVTNTFVMGEAQHLQDPPGLRLGQGDERR